MGLSGSDQAYLPSRSGIARSDAVRSGTYWPTVIVKIGGADRSRAVELSSLVIDDVIADQPNRLTCEVRGTSAEKPIAGQSIVVALGADQPELRLFTGTILTVTQRMPRSAGNYASWLVDATDDQWILDRRTVTAAYVGVSATTVALDIVARFTTSFSGRYIATNLPPVSVTFTNARPSTALAAVASMVGGTFYWDDARHIHLYTTAPTGQMPPPLTATNTKFWGIEIRADLSQVRTCVTVEGRRTPCLTSTPAGASSITIFASASVDYLVVGGGGAGGGSLAAGGGAGGVLAGTMTIASGTYPVTVGAGGSGGTPAGGNSTWNGITAVGGGRGGDTGNNGGTGGSGGGGAFGTSPGSGTSGQGQAGGAGFSFAAGAGGGGGGAAGVGGAGSANVSGTVGGNGGAGVGSSITGVVAYYGGGGGGNGSAASGSGGLGGGGRGGAGGNPGTAGTANTGGGGGGGGSYAGGSGVVKLRYLTGELSATGGTITTAGGYTIHSFTSGANFVVSDVVLTAPPALVTDLPIEDATQLDPDGGEVRIGAHVVSYVGLLGPGTPSGENQPGSFLAADVAVAATSITVDDITAFTGAYGWVKAGDQVIRYGSKSGSNLQGIAAVGLGAIQSDLKAETPVTYLDGIRISETGVTFDPPVAQHEPVIQRVTIDETAAQAELAALEGGDGVHEHVIDAETLTVQGCIDRANAELDQFARVIPSVTYATRDTTTRAGRIVTIDLQGLPSVTGTFTIQQVTTRFESAGGGTTRRQTAFPVRQVTAAPVRVRSILDTMSLREDAIP